MKKIIAYKAAAAVPECTSDFWHQVVLLTVGGGSETDLYWLNTQCMQYGFFSCGL